MFVQDILLSIKDEHEDFTVHLVMTKAQETPAFPRLPRGHSNAAV